MERRAKALLLFLSKSKNRNSALFESEQLLSRITYFICFVPCNGELPCWTALIMQLKSITNVCIVSKSFNRPKNVWILLCRYVFSTNTGAPPYFLRRSPAINCQNEKLDDML